MKLRQLFRYVIAPLAVAVLVLLALAQPKATAAKALSIEGTYILASRDLPDGSSVKAPDVSGMVTYTKKYRNFNVTWKSAAGKRISLSYVAEYTLTADAYKEVPIYWMWYDESQGTTTFTWPPDKAKPSVVTVKDGKISFPINGEPVTATFDGTGFTAVASGQFTDHWKKVD